jgi:hypothetical protein
MNDYEDTEYFTGAFPTLRTGQVDIFPHLVNEASRYRLKPGENG